MELYVLPSDLANVFDPYVYPSTCRNHRRREPVIIVSTYHTG